ncbi:PREDICTED: uncharacterized protein LOC109193673 [Ipomoea nil]|uniref:uncharacterized protein LOC109193673 n=1 Tax=Ipomoea nil TaxID=35883 RepID=UPI000901023C|nr:PREDICTED: uncharacterized protein LOC109193673 [Ipomoea nil]
MRQLDVHNAFLNGRVSEEIYMRQPPGYANPNCLDYVCKLQRLLYGLKQAPRAWFTRLHDFLVQIGFCPSKTNVSLFIYDSGTARVYILVYVDDILLMGNDSAMLKKLSTVFHICDLRKLRFFLGIEATEMADSIVLSQKRYMTELLRKAAMESCKPLATHIALNTQLTPGESDTLDDLTPYRQLVGSLMYLLITRPDLAYSVNKLCQFMHTPTQSHWAALKRVLRYVKGSLDLGLHLAPTATPVIHTLSNSNWVGCSIDTRSTGGYVVFLGPNLLSWVSRKQRTVARSSTEAEYKALADVAAEVTWIQSLLRELWLLPSTIPLLWCDNLGATYLCSTPRRSMLKWTITLSETKSQVVPSRLTLSPPTTSWHISSPSRCPAVRFNDLRHKLGIVPCPR